MESSFDVGMEQHVGMCYAPIERVEPKRAYGSASRADSLITRSCTVTWPSGRMRRRTRRATTPRHEEVKKNNTRSRARIVTLTLSVTARSVCYILFPPLPARAVWRTVQLWPTIPCVLRLSVPALWRRRFFRAVSAPKALLIQSPGSRSRGRSDVGARRRGLARSGRVSA